ncbi:MAG: DUF3810 family protein [Myxococcota bacterium]
MERIEIPGHATYSPVALTDLLIGAPLASRLLLGAVLPGNLVSGLALGLYAASSARDWAARLGVRPIDFRQEFDADVKHLRAMPEEARWEEVKLLGAALNLGYTGEARERPVVARQVNQRLTDYVASITGQEIVTSSELRGFNIAAVVFPFAYGTCDVISGDVAIFKDTGIFEPHIIAHEFSHRKGYFKELYAQALSYMALRTSADPYLIQAARAERMHRQLRVLGGESASTFEKLLEVADLRPELRQAFVQLRPEPGMYESAVGKVMRKMYDQRMKLTGQNGLSDYDEGFTNFLWTFANSSAAKQPRSHAAL